MGDDLPSAFAELTESVKIASAAVPSPWRDRPLVLCLSGGIDSSALAILFSRPEISRLFPGGIEAVHARHGLRGGESEGDADSVRELCGRLGLALRLVDAEVPPGAGLESRARAARYAALREAAPEAILATAHHREDQAETVVLRLLRGAHARGLAGIKPWREDGIWRPLLDACRPDLQRVCAAAHWEPRVDSSNADTRYRRNEIRLDLLPRWEAEEPGVAKALVGLAEATRGLSPWLERTLDGWNDLLHLEIDVRGFSLVFDGTIVDSSDPHFELVLDRAWTRVGRRPWAKAQRARLLADTAAGKVGSRRGGQGEIATFGGGRLRIERSS